MPNITTLRNAVSTVQEATELLSTATQLGMSIPAPQGTHVYLYKLSYTPKELRKTVKDLPTTHNLRNSVTEPCRGCRRYC